VFFSAGKIAKTGDWELGPIILLRFQLASISHVVIIKLQCANALYQQAES